MKKAAILLLCMAIASKNTASAFAEQENNLPELNEEGFFAEPFARGLDLESSVEYSDGAKLFWSALSEESLEALNSLKTAGEVFESAGLTFYPNGGMRVAYRMTDAAYNAFSESEVFKMIIPQSAEQEYQYTVDSEAGTVTTEDGTVYTIDQANGALTKESILKAEVYSVPQEMTGDAVAIKEVNYTIMQDVSYVEDPSDERGRMDLYIPNDLDPKKNNGAFFVIYGGSWTSGDKKDMQLRAEEFASAGYVAVAVNMHNAFYNEETQKTEVTVYDMLDDIQASVRKLKDLSDENGWNITQCATYGESSGANIAMLYGYSRGASDVPFDTEEVLPVRFVADVVGPVDMHDSAWAGDEEWPDRERMHSLGAGPAYAFLLTGAANQGELTEEETENCINSMSPVYYVQTCGGVPTVMGYSGRDFIQNPNNGKILQGYLDGQSVENDLFTFPNSIHGYTADPEEAQAFFDKMMEYAEKYFE